MNNGWISLHRKIMNNPLWTSEKFTRGQAWVDLILLANHTDGYIVVHGHKIQIKRGQIGWSELKLAERWRWSRTKVRTFVKLLETEQQVIQQKHFKSSIITIINYEKYQNKDIKKTASEQQVNSKKTASEQQEDTNNKKEQLNNENNINNISPEIKNFVEDYQKYAVDTFGPSANKVTASLILKGSDTIDKLIRLDGFTFTDVSDAIRWASTDDFWASQIKSLASLRKKSKNGMTKFQNLFDSFNKKSKITGSKITDHNLAAAMEFLNG